jgi:uncharacterized protein YqcC (DUF446 family)
MSYGQLAGLLMDTEQELRRLDLWQTQSPSEEALASTEPFAVDQLSFDQWLQFIFLPRMHKLIDAKAPLPEQCSIAPMAEEFFKAQEINGATVVAVLAAIDQLITQA